MTDIERDSTNVYCNCDKERDRVSMWRTWSSLINKASSGQCKETGDSETTVWDSRSRIAKVAGTIAQLARCVSDVKFWDRLAIESRALNHCCSTTAAYHASEPDWIVCNKSTNACILLYSGRQKLTCLEIPRDASYFQAFCALKKPKNALCNGDVYSCVWPLQMDI